MTDHLTIPLTQRLRTVSDMINMGEKIAWGSETALMGEAADALDATALREAEYRSIFRRCVEIIGFHNGGDDEKIEAIRRTMLQAPHLKEEDNG